MQCFEDGTVSEIVPVGVGSPYTVTYEATTTDPLINLLDVTATRFEVLRENGIVETWPAVIDLGATTQTFLRMIHAVVSTDFPEPGLVYLSPVLTLPTGEVVCEPKIVQAVSQFDPALVA